MGPSTDELAMAKTQLTPAPSSNPETPAALKSGDYQAGIEVRRTIGPFIVQEEIGHGGMGVVYRGIAPDGTPVAVKVLHRRAEAVLAERFKREAAIRIDHLNVVKVLDAGADADGTLYIAFELLEGESLAQRFAKTRATPQDVVDIGLQACRGLAAVHDRMVVHRDLKPANLFRTTDGTIKVLDFGIAFLADEDVRLTKTGAIVGTPAYLSPEQARGESPLDLRTDVWALGTALFEALVGRPPYSRDTPIATMIAVVMETCPPLRELAPSTPVDLVRAIERALAKSKEDRWPTMNAFAEALASADLTPPVSAALTTVEPHLAIARGERRVVAVIVVLGVADSESVKRVIVSHGGVFLPLLGHKAIGLFGGSHWEGDEILRAADAALEVKKHADRVAVGSGHAMSTTTGLSGRAVKGAEQLLARNDSDAVLTDAETAAALRAEFELGDLAEGSVAVLSRRPQGERRAAAPARRLVGREAEIAQLRQGLKTALYEERALAIVVSGPPGIGKTRLREEMTILWDETLIADERAGTQLLGRAAPHRRDIALSLFESVLVTHASRLAAESGGPRIALDAPADERRRAVLQLAREAIDGDDDARECAAFLGELAGVRMDDSEILATARKYVRLMTDRLRIALREYFVGLASRGPLALLVEDLQWADAESLDLLDELMERLQGVPFLLFATARPELREARPDLFRGNDVMHVEPRGLVSSDVALLARGIAGRPLDKQLVKEITERTSGNPLFVEHIVLALVDLGMLDAAGEREAAALPIPLTVEAAVQSRLDHLPIEEKEIIKRASLLRRPFFVDEIEALGVSSAEKHLSSLVRRDLVSSRLTDRTQEAKRYKIRSMLVADVAYLMIAKPLRAELHRKAAAFLLGSARQNPEEIAIHFERGDEPNKAAESYERAAIAASERGDSKSVLRCSQRALSLGVKRGSIYALRMARAEALQFLGKREEQMRELAEALEQASTESERGRALAEQSWWMSNMGRPEDALAIAESAVLAAKRGGDREVLARALGRQVVALIHAGRLKEARDALREATLLTSGAPLQLRALAQSWRAQLASALGDLGERRDAFQSAMWLYSKVGDIRSAAGAEANLADAYNRIGAYAEAEAALARAIEGCRRVGNRLMEGYAELNRGYSLAMMGRTADAIEALDAAAAIAQATQNRRLAICAAIYRARADLGHEGADRAFNAAVLAAEDARAISLPAQRAQALLIAARAKLALNDSEGACAFAREALEIRDQLGSVEEDEAEIFLVYSETLIALGRREEAAAVLARGRKILEAVALGIGDPEQRRRYLEDVAAHRSLCALSAEA
jgi:eukaryotic-like serine/threonine-protein kinase